ncbi:MAG: hypothetical protein RSH52_28595, partial [Janthinobacterium sp.]
AALALYLVLRPGEPPAPPPEKAEPDLFAFVHSMQGTRPDGNVTVAAGDKLVVDAELAHLFDYYLAGLGEKPLAAIRSQIEAELDRRLAPVPAREAKRLLGAYLAYKQALLGAEQALPAQADAALAARAPRYAGLRLPIDDMPTTSRPSAPIRSAPNDEIEATVRGCAAITTVLPRSSTTLTGNWSARAAPAASAAPSIVIAISPVFIGVAPLHG